MKKLMLGFAMAAALVAAADVESSNIVGYATKDTCANYSLAIGMFNEVGKTTLPLQTVIPEGENVDGEGGLTIQTFTSDANADEVFQWLTVDAAGVDVDGWYNDSFELVEKTLAKGEGFMVGSTSAIQLRVAGEVDLAQKVVECGQNYSLLGNFRPVALALQDIVPDASADGEGGLTIQTFTDEANSDEVYQWLTVDAAGVDVDGWYNDSFELVEKNFTPGEGFMLGTPAAVSLTFKAIAL